MLKDIYCNSNLVVDIIMPTYNHEEFIAQSIQSVLMQECSFRYRLIIGDDCSTDNTQKICELYAKANADRILLLRHPFNLGLAGNYKSLFDISSAKYTAILEGDDYWIDKQKLQKQIEILESHQDIGLVHTNYYSLYKSGRLKKGHVWEKPDSLSGFAIGPTQTANMNINPLTACFRSLLAKENVDFDFIVNNNLLTVDIFLWAEVCRRSKVLYLDEVTGVYRIHTGSITGNRNINSIEKFSTTSLLSVNYLMEKYNTPRNVKETFYSQNKLNLIYQFLLAGQPLKAKLELQNVNVILTIEDKIIYLSAKYRPLNFLCHVMALFYQYGSRTKQFINWFVNLLKPMKQKIKDH